MNFFLNSHAILEEEILASKEINIPELKYGTHASIVYLNKLKYEKRSN
jgi:hypothetical protein